MPCGNVDELTPRGGSTVLFCNWNFKAIFIDCITVLLESWNNEAYQNRNGNMYLETCLWSITRNCRKFIAHFQNIEMRSFASRIICLTRTAGRDVKNLIKIDWNFSKVESFVGKCLFTDNISNVGKSLICCIYLFARDFRVFFTTRILNYSNFSRLLVGK